MAYDPTQDPYRAATDWYFMNDPNGKNMQALQFVSQGAQIFAQNFQNLTGRPPTDQELQAYTKNALANAVDTPGGSSYQDLTGLAQGYVQNQFGPQAAQYQQQQQTSQLGQSQQLLQNLVNQSMQNTSSALADPNSQIYQALAGTMNNTGITPGSGAFQAGAGSTIANAGLEAANQGLQSIGIPGIQNIAGLTSVPYSQSFTSGTTGMGNLENLSNFQLQADLARQLQNMSEPSGLQKDLGMASGAASGAGNLLKGGAAAYQATPSYVCREMLRRGLLCESDLEDFYLHMFDAVWYKARAFWHYKVNGQKLVDAVNERGLDWKAFKALLFDRVMEEPDACKANELFADACHQLCISAAPDLWDERVMRSSVWDSLPFLPLLFMDSTFGRNFWRILRIKTLILFDKPRCEVHQ